MCGPDEMVYVVTVCVVQMRWFMLCMCGLDEMVHVVCVVQMRWFMLCVCVCVVQMRWVLARLSQ